MSVRDRALPSAGSPPTGGEPRPLRVLMATPHYFPSMGGVETHVYEVARRLAAAGVDVTVVTTDSSGALPAVEHSEGVRVRRVGVLTTAADSCFAPDVYRIVRDGHWDIVHAQGCQTLVAPLAMLAARRARIPYVVTFHTGGHSSRARSLLRGAQWSVIRPFLARADRLIGVSRFEADFFRDRLSLPAARFAVIPNGGHLPATTESAVAASAGAPIVSIGRLERYKGHHRVIAALPYVRERYPAASLLILGQGPYGDALRRLARRQGVSDYVDIRAIPAQRRQDMAAALAQASVVTLLSEYEAHPIAVMEALALRRPVLVAATSGLNELAERGLVRAVPLDSGPRQVAAALLDQIERPLMPPEGITIPTWDDCAAGLLALYRDMVRSHRAPRLEKPAAPPTNETDSR